MKWYQVFSIISGTLILIAVFILAFKMINAGMNTARKNEAIMFWWYCNSFSTIIY